LRSTCLSFPPFGTEKLTGRFGHQNADRGHAQREGQRRVAFLRLNRRDQPPDLGQRLEGRQVTLVRPVNALLVVLARRAAAKG
jgi:hypothetical protein